MASLSIKDKIKMWVGVFEDEMYLQELLNRAGEETIDALPEDSLWPFISEVTDSGSGANISGVKVITAHKEGISAKPIRYHERNKWNAVANDPLYYEAGTLLYVLPNGGSVVIATPPTTDLDALSIPNVVKYYEDMVVSRAADLAIQQKMAELRNDITPGITLPTAPTALAAPSWAYTGPTATVAADTSIDISGLAAPAFTEPTKAPAWTTFETAIGEGDIEDAALRVQRYATELNEYQAEVAAQVAEFNETVEIYRQNVTVAIQNGQLDQQRLLEEAGRTDNLALKNEAERVGSVIAQWQALAKANELGWAEYRSELEGNVAELQAKVDSTSQKLRMYQFDRTRLAELFQTARRHYIRRNMRRKPLQPNYQDY